MLLAPNPVILPEAVERALDGCCWIAWADPQQLVDMLAEHGIVARSKDGASS